MLFKSAVRTFCTTILYSTLHFPGIAAAQTPSLATDLSSAQPENHLPPKEQIHKLLGLAPRFLDAVPPAVLPGAWDELKQLKIEQSSIPQKYQHLIWLAISTQLPCTTCGQHDRNLALLEGATEQEVNEAVAMAALTKHWSTFINGMLIEESAYRKEVDARALALKRRGRPPQHASILEAPPARTARSSVLDTGPEFMQLFPDKARPGAWKVLRDFELSSSTALPPLYKELIGLVVAAQIPCRFSIYWHTQLARAYGASEEQLRHTIALASLRQSWATIYLNPQVDQQQLQQDLDQIVTNARQGMDAQPTASN